MQAAIPHHASTAKLLKALYPIYFKMRKAKLPAIDCANYRIA